MANDVYIHVCIHPRVLSSLAAVEAHRADERREAE